MADPQMPPAEMPMPAGDPSGAPPEAGGAFEICIAVAADGSMSVYAEPAGEPPAEGALPAATLEEAMGIAKQIIDAKGQMPQGNGMTVEDAFSDGFKGSQVA